MSFLSAQRILNSPVVTQIGFPFCCLKIPHSVFAATLTTSGIWHSVQIKYMLLL